jgi:ABC-type sugar transport system substrate-binding protein
MIVRSLTLMVLFVILTLPKVCQADSFKVVFLNPGHESENTTGSFWSNVALFMAAAAKDLDIELVTLYANRNHIIMKSLVSEIILHNPDYIVLVNEKGIALNIIKEISTHDIPVFMLLNTLNNQDTAFLTEQERSIITGSLIPDNYIVGKQLLNGLLDLYEALPIKEGADNNRTLLALEGDFTTPASLERERGFSDVLKVSNNIEIIDNTVANWSKEQAYQKVKGLLKRNRIDMIWAANDAMAFGAKQAVNEANIEYPVVIGGINWDIDHDDITISLSYGGHVTLGALALVMLRDIDNNDLSIEERHQVASIFESSLSSSYPLFTKRLRLNQLDNYDFSRFCRSSKKPLNFTVDNLAKSYKLTENK